MVELLLESSGNPFVPNDTHLQVGMGMDRPVSCCWLAVWVVAWLSFPVASPIPWSMLQLPDCACTNVVVAQGDGRRCMLITGPNMGGKSCYSRQGIMPLLDALCRHVWI